MNPSEPEDLGQPVAILRDQELDTRPDFAARVTRSIHRREVASQAASYSWAMPKAALAELARLIAHIFQTFGKEQQR